MAIVWNRVTPYSQVIAIILFVGVYALGFWLGEMNGAARAELASVMVQNPPASQPAPPQMQALPAPAAPGSMPQPD